MVPDWSVLVDAGYERDFDKALADCRIQDALLDLDPGVDGFFSFSLGQANLDPSQLSSEVADRSVSLTSASEPLPAFACPRLSPA